MGRLVHQYVDGPDVIHSRIMVIRGVRKRQSFRVPTKIRVSFDPGDRKYRMVDGRLRRRPETIRRELRRSHLMSEAAE